MSTTQTSFAFNLLDAQRAIHKAGRTLDWAGDILDAHARAVGGPVVAGKVWTDTMAAMPNRPLVVGPALVTEFDWCRS
jgi:hypothetical protein